MITAQQGVSLLSSEDINAAILTTPFLTYLMKLTSELTCLGLLPNVA